MPLPLSFYCVKTDSNAEKSLAKTEETENRNHWQKQKRLKIQTNQNLRAWTLQRFQTKGRAQII
jgi:uncharacterized ion transporter superfamily protein YfcC